MMDPPVAPGLHEELPSVVVKSGGGDERRRNDCLGPGGVWAPTHHAMSAAERDEISSRVKQTGVDDLVRKGVALGHCW